jgi:hypothetical protein
LKKSVHFKSVICKKLKQQEEKLQHPAFGDDVLQRRKVAIFFVCQHGLRTPDEAFFQRCPKIFGQLGRSPEKTLRYLRDIFWVKPAATILAL